MNFKNIADHYLSIVRFANYTLAIIIAFTLAFPNKVIFPLWTLWMITWALEGRFFETRNFSFQKYKIPLLLLGFFYFWHSVNMIFTIDGTVSWSNFERQFSFLAMVPIVLYGVNDYYKTRTILFSIIVGALLTTVIYYMIMMYVNNIELFMYGYKYGVWNSFPTEIYSVWVNVFKHRLYYCTVLLIALIALFFVRGEVTKRYGRMLSLLFVLVASVAFIGTIVLTGSRSTIIVLAIIASIAFYRLMLKKYKLYITLGVFLFLSAFITLLLKYHPRMKSVTLESLNILSNGGIYNSEVEPRLYIWHTALNHIDEYFWVGKGAGQSTSFLIQKYEEDNYPESFKVFKYGSHNQYLGEFIDLGVVGLLFLIVLFVLYHRFFTARAFEISIYLSVVLAFNLITESMMGRLEGIIIICFSSLICVWMELEQNRKSIV